LPIRQQPQYDDANMLAKVEAELAALPALVSPAEVRNLKEELAQVAAGEAFLLQGGDCAESFAEFNERNLRHFARVILQMTIALMYGAGSPVVKVGRIAGQFAKPRSDNMETIGGVSRPSYRGDMINGADFEAISRAPDPERLLKVYYQSAATLNFLRSLFRGEFASLTTISGWNMDFVATSAQGKRFATIVERLDECMSFIKACGLTPSKEKRLSEATFYTSHEGLFLNYEQPFTRFDEEDELHYACSAHMLWIGDRTRDPHEAHVEWRGKPYWLQGWAFHDS
jgi:3-deoxy-7-phosphoheptulonate synthase